MGPRSGLDFYQGGKKILLPLLKFETRIGRPVACSRTDFAIPAATYRVYLPIQTAFCLITCLSLRQYLPNFMFSHCDLLLL